MQKNNQIITDFSKVTFLYHEWAINYGINYTKMLVQLKLTLYPVARMQSEPFFGNWHYFDDLDVNEDRPHFTLINFKNEIFFDDYDFFENHNKAFLLLLGFWKKGLTFITYLNKLYIHFNLPFSPIEFNFIDLYFSMLASIDELVLFLKENNELADLKDKNLNKFNYIATVVNHIISYPDFVNLFFAWSNQSLKYKDKWADLSPSNKVKEILLAELSVLSIDTLCYLSLNLPWTLEQHKLDADERQEELSRAFRPIFENMLKAQKGEKTDPDFPLLTPIDIKDLIK